MEHFNNQYVLINIRLVVFLCKENICMYTYPPYIFIYYINSLEEEEFLF